LFSVTSFVCDAVDGWAARKFNQGIIFHEECRPSELFWTWLQTGYLYLFLPGLFFLSLLALDITSHWLQMSFRSSLTQFL
ncbi:hypothetical protein HN51_054357, partial [Arachis hypogaea]